MAVKTCVDNAPHFWGKDACLNCGRPRHEDGGLREDAAGATPELLAERARLRASEERSTRRRAWQRTRGSANRYYWRERYVRLPDGEVAVLYADGSGGDKPMRDDPVDVLNRQAAQLEVLSERAGYEHSARGVFVSVLQALRLAEKDGADAKVGDQSAGDWARSLVDAWYQRQKDDYRKLRDLHAGSEKESR